MRLAPLFDLRARHGFFPDDSRGGLQITPAAASVAAMRGRGLVSKALGEQMAVFVRLNGRGEPAIPFTAPIVLDFHAVPSLPDFPLITDCTEIAAQPAPLFTNAATATGEATALRLGSIEAWGSETLSVVAADAAVDYALAGRPVDGIDIVGFRLANAGPAKVTGYDPATRRMTCDLSGTTVGQQFTVRYPVRPRLPRDVFAAIRVTVDEPMMARAVGGRPDAYTLALAARTTRWCYYVVTTRPTPLSVFAIVDGSPTADGPPVVFGDAGRRDLTADPDAEPADDPIAADLGRRHPAPGWRVIRLLSDAPVAVRQAPARRLDLRVDGTTLITSLANPRPADFAMVRLPQSGMESREQVLYSIVRLDHG